MFKKQNSDQNFLLCSNTNTIVPFFYYIYLTNYRNTKIVMLIFYDWMVGAYFTIKCIIRYCLSFLLCYLITTMTLFEPYDYIYIIILLSIWWNQETKSSYSSTVRIFYSNSQKIFRPFCTHQERHILKQNLLAKDFLLTVSTF